MISEQSQESYITQLFGFDTAHGTVSGQIHKPLGNGLFPVLLLFRGYVDKEIYVPGIGTRNVARFFATRGFITIAPIV